MGGICGWIPFRERPSAGAEEGRLREILTGAMAHRGPVEWLELPRAGAAAVAAGAGAPGRESLLKGWEEAGGDLLRFASGLEGAGTIALLDRSRKVLVLVRDRLGERPLAWTVTPGGVAFATEMKALRAAGLGGDALRPEALDAYLAFTYIPAPWTIYSGIGKLPAAHVAFFDLSGESPAATLRRYWQAPPREGLPATPEAALERLAAALARRVPSREGFTAFLSGGLDSSLVVALLNRAGHRKVPTFSAGFDEGGLDESRHSRRVARLLDTDHHEVMLTDVTVETARRVIAQLDEPMADAASLPTWVLAGCASRSASVALTGDGADALLAGDHWFRRVARADRLAAIPPMGRKLIGAVAGAAGGRSGARTSELARLAAVPPCHRYLRIREKWTPEQRLAIYEPGFRQSVDPALASGTYLNAPVEWREGESVDAAMRLDSIHGLPEDLLMKVDKMGMAHGVQCRSPFLDREWVEWTSRLDVNLLLRKGRTKDLLKRAAESLLPRDLIYRRKQGFRVPMGRWLKGPLRELTEEAFAPGFVKTQGIFDGGAMADLRREFDSSPASSALDGRVWQVVAFQTWWQGEFS